eukprot:gnl/TRDRNA2_/TRDRNA2_129947_c0_seq1.p1 gnl/TRDRNA2_/TRDRNA2_129947_c0~~gnl/TRDRNA2_/TRDRNA2_129947_c0_seq1.p1  ORF type:complete len:1229 (-),score=203.05 gnl/TRDRNA2_/TRDRNA2_129947_c0_seq1:528-3872(-)
MPTESSLEDGLLDGDDTIQVDCQKMIRCCIEQGLTHGLEAASLAVALAVQRRRSYASSTSGVLSKTGTLKEIDVELDAPKMTFTSLLLAADKALQNLQGSTTTGSTEQPEFVFAWNRTAADEVSPGHWTVRPVSATHLQVAANSLAEERTFKIMFEACAANPEGNVWEAPTATENDSKAMLALGMHQMDFANYRDPVSQRLLPVPHLLAASPKDPQADAVVGDGFTLSYAELYRRKDVVSRAVLAAMTPGGRKTAIVYMPRGEAIAPAFLGLLQAGFQVVPVDVHWPADRAIAVAQDSKASVVLIEPNSSAHWHALKCDLPVVSVDAALFRGSQQATSAFEQLSLDQDDPAILLFTSGSTGKPKGIMLSHGYLTGLTSGIADFKCIGSKSRALCYHSPTWMPFLDYLFAPLLKGGCCIYFPQTETHVVKPMDLSDFANRFRATHIGFVPAMLDIFLQNGLPKSITGICCGGAPVPSELCHRVVNTFPEGAVMYSGYSGTEIGDVTSGRYRCPADVDMWANDNGFMGACRPYSGQRIALLDEAMQVVGPGGIGEITVTGPVLASGYLDLPEKTAEVFLPKCEVLGGARAARSGDLAKWTETGNLKVVGRRDAMVKVRGARIELGEVEAAVLSHAAVKTAVVTVYEDQLVAYVVPAVPADLREHCKKRLVAYMVPHIFEGIEELPKLANGKVNKKALPKPSERTDGAETVLELDSLGQMRKFTRNSASEDRVMDNVRAILIGIVIQSHATPLLPTGATMLDVASRPLGANWGPWQLFLLQLTRGGGWSSLAFLNGFDDTRGATPYSFTYREPLFLLLWLVLDFNWTMWFLPAFVLMRAAFCASHWLGIERLHLVLFSQVWILMPAFVDLYIGWQPQSPNIATECPSGCFCPWQAWPQAQTIAYYTLGWWVAGNDPLKHSMVGHALVFIPCYWIGFYFGGRILKVLANIADETSILRRLAVAAGVLGLYYGLFMWGSSLLNEYDDRCSAFWGPDGNFIYEQIFKNGLNFVMNLAMSLTYVVFITAAVPIHMKYLAKVCFSALVCSAFTPCLLDFSAMAVELRRVLPAAISPVLETVWIFSVPFLYELVAGACIGAVLPVVAKVVMKAAAAVRSKAAV